MKLKSNIRLAICCCTHAAAYLFMSWVVFIEFKNEFKISWKWIHEFVHKKKKENIYSFLILWIWPTGPASPPFAPIGPWGRCPPSPLARPNGRTPLFLDRPVGQRALPPPSADVRSPPSSAADAWAHHPAVSYLPPQLEEPSSFATAAGDRAIARFLPFGRDFRRL
jgi:hypothetical protein